MKRIILILIVIGLLALVFGYFGSGKHADIPPISDVSIDQAELIARGRDVAIASDCVACHTLPHGAPFAGGMEFHSPFGLIMATNITPDPTYGIGTYSREDFFRAVKHGYSKNVGNLYPAMPYTSYRLLADQDMDAMWAYFQSIDPIAVPNKPNDLMFPANIRFSLGFWNQMFFDDSDFQQDPQKSEQWNRGKYLVESAGHCGECHTPRNFAFAMKPDEALRGEVLEGWTAVDITTAELTEQGWTADDMNRFLATGQSPLGITFESMYMVVDHSLSQIDTADIAAITAFLLDQQSVEFSSDPENVRQIPHDYLSDTEKSLPGYSTYMSYCAGCHGVDGLGKPDSVVVLNRNSIYSSDSAFNAIAVVLRGLPGKHQSLTQGSYAMPAFADDISDREIAELVNFARQVWGGSNPDIVGAAQVNEVRELLQEEGWLQ